jgi:asparagine synthase (glutamine-hydrolysing)
MKVRGGAGKHILRQVLYRCVPRELIDRPKKGFGVPVAEWLRGPLAGWAADLLERRRLLREGFFNPEAVHDVWSRHLSGAGDCKDRLWNILVFQSWLECQ